MNIEKFAKEIRKKSDRDRRWTKLMLVVYVCACFFEPEIDNIVIDEMLYLAIRAVVVVGFAMRHINQYIRMKTDTGFGSTEDESLCKVAGNHAFPVKEYFAFIRKKLIIWQGIILVIGVIKPFMEKQYIDILFSVVMALLPFAVSFMMQKIFEYRMCHTVSLKVEFLSGIFKMAFDAIEVIVLFVYTILAWFIIWAFITDGLIVNFNQNEIVYRAFKDETAFIVMLVAFIVFIYACAISSKKISRYVRIISAIVVVVSGIVSGIMENNYYTEITPDSIVVVNREDRREYTFEDVETFKVYSEDESIQVILYFNDGKSELLFSGASTSSEAYDEAYYSEYNFVADLVKKLLENGAEGIIEDVEELGEDIEGLDVEVKKGLDEIVGLLQRK